MKVSISPWYVRGYLDGHTHLLRQKNMTARLFLIAIFAMLLPDCGGRVYTPASQVAPNASGSGIASAVRTAATPTRSSTRSGSRARFSLVVLGALGGPQSVVQVPYQSDLNNAGTVAGCADTSKQDPNYPNFNPFVLPDPPIQPDPYIFHAFSWEDGDQTDLGGFHGMSSCPNWISDSGAIVGGSLNGKIDSYNGWPAMEAVLWQDARRISLGTFGGSESYAVVANNHGEVAGAAANTIPDPYSVFFGWGTQTRAFLWRDGHKKDLGTLGGPDALAMYVDDHGRVFGASYLNDTPNQITGIPPFDAFVWQGDKMRDIASSCGGSQVNPIGANDRGQLVGNASRADEMTDCPFLWDNGVFKQLPTIGAYSGQAEWINDSGQAVGQLFFYPSGNNEAMLWEHNQAHKLGILPGDCCSRANAINARGEVVGCSGTTNSGACLGPTHAALFEHHHILDLNAQITQSSLLLTDADSINDSGEIVGVGILPSGDYRAYLLIPCEGRELRSADCQKPAREIKDIPHIPEVEARRFDRVRSGLKPLFSWQRFASRARKGETL